LKNASARGDKDASKFLGEIYYEGQGVLRNNQTATRYFKHVGLLGSVDAKYNARYLMVTTSESFIDGMAWIEIAAHHGHEKARQMREKAHESAS